MIRAFHAEPSQHGEARVTLVRDGVAFLTVSASEGKMLSKDRTIAEEVRHKLAEVIS